MFSQHLLIMNWVCLVSVNGWTYAAEDEVQACRDLLSSNLVTVYADGDRYIVTNVLTGAYMGDKQPVYVRGTRSQKVSKDALLRMARDLEEIADERPEYYTRSTSTESPTTSDVKEYVNGILMYIICMIIWICYRCCYR